MIDDQDKSCEKVLLKGTLKAEEISAKIIASLNLGIKKYTFSGSRIDRVAVNQNSGSSLRNFKDDPNIHRSIRSMAYARNV